MDSILRGLLVDGQQRADRFAMPLLLLVEDNPVEREIASQVLENAGFQVVSVESGEEALITVPELMPDLILMDAILPGIDGFEVCDQLRKHPRVAYIPIVMLTSLEDVDSIDRAYQVGANDFFTKPMPHTLLVHRIRYMLRATQAFNTLRMSQQSLANAQQVAQMGYWEVDLDNRQIELSEGLYGLYKLPHLYQRQELWGLVEYCHPDDREGVQMAIANAIMYEDITPFEHRIIRPDGSLRYISVHMSISESELTQSRHLTGISLDVTESKLAERQSLNLAYFDLITGLPRRPLLERYLPDQIALSHLQGGVLCLLCLDLDLFSRINNAMGHEAGDAVLRELGERLTRLLQPISREQWLDQLSVSQPGAAIEAQDIVARLGADSFVIALSGEHRDSPRIEQLTSKVMALFQQPFTYLGHELFITASLGVTFSESGSCSPSLLLQQADLALHDAKSSGRNQVNHYHSALVDRVSSTMAIQNQLRKALESNQFELFYQPKVDLAEQQVKGFEALLRWQHPQRGFISPSDIIEVAEECGEIVQIGRWVLEQACRAAKTLLQDRGISGRMAVNLSARQFKEPDLVGMVSATLQRTGLRSEYLELEITEGVLVAEHSAADVLDRLRQLGVSIALDDFGTGFSSLSYLIRFPFDTLKIDRSFIRHIQHGSDQAAIVSAVTTLSHQLSLYVVVEGVESDQELEVVSELGCDAVQGYRFCKPLPKAELESWLANWSNREALCE